jgi:hypothetical protein
MIERDPAVVEKRSRPCRHAPTPLDHEPLVAGASEAPDPNTPAAAPGPSRTSRPLTLFRSVTLACAGVMTWAPGYLLDAAILAGIALVRP